MPDAGIGIGVGQHESGQIGAFAQVQAGEDAQAGEIERLVAARRPDAGGEERGRSLDLWLSTRFRYSFSREGMRLASAAIANTSRLFMKVSRAGLAARMASSENGSRSGGAA